MSALQNERSTRFAISDKAHFAVINLEHRRYLVALPKKNCSRRHRSCDTRKIIQKVRHDLYHVTVTAFVAIFLFKTPREIVMKAYAIILAVAVVLAGGSLAQEQGATHKHHMQGGATPETNLPKEAGQAAFAAIQEIVAKLEGDPKTDWSKVDIEALRRHLIDMNNVTLGANIQVEEQANSIRFVVTGEETVRGSIQRMIKGHAETMDGSNGLKFEASEIDDGASLTVTPQNGVDLKKLRALGLVGIMAQGMHHPSHHWMLATGQNPHG